MERLLLTYMFLQYGQAVYQEAVYGIGIKLCNLKCIQKGSCMSFAYNIERLECRLSYKDDTKLAEEGYVTYPKKGKEVSAGACSLVNCGPDTQCVKRRSGDTICVKDVSEESGRNRVLRQPTIQSSSLDHRGKPENAVEVKKHLGDTVWVKDAVPEVTGRNIAQGKPTIQSSTLNGLGKAKGAVDGNRGPHFSYGSCAHTRHYRRQWWIVDLKHVYTINMIVIYNRNTLQERLDNTMVEGFLHYPPTCDKTDASSSVLHAGPSGNVVNVSFARSTRAQFIRISSRRILTLCEVEVYGLDTNDDQGRIDSTIEVKTGTRLSIKAIALGLWKSHEACLSACKKLPNCYFVNHNVNTGECQTAAGLVRMKEFKKSSNWNLYSLC